MTTQKKDKKLEVGMKVFAKPGVNRSRYSKEIDEGEIIKVGRKYFEVNFGGYQIVKFYKDSLEQVTEYAPEYILYFSKEEILEEEELISNAREINTFFYFTDMHSLQKQGITLEKTRKILEILRSK